MTNNNILSTSVFLFIGIMAILLFSILSESAVAATTPISFPDDANIVDVKRDYGAKGDGITDDTAAINQALFEHNANTAYSDFASKTIYFPAGTYLVSDTLMPSSLDIVTPNTHAVRFIGAGVNDTVIKLKNSAPGFTDPSNPKPLIQTGTKSNAKPSVRGNTGFGNYIQHLTIDTGANNPGAIGVKFYAANSGAINHVKIRTSDSSKRGVYGLTLQNSSGPAYIKDVTVDGFDYGVRFERSFSNHIALEDITVRNQKIAGITAERLPFQIVNLTSENNPIAVRSTSIGSSVIIVSANLNGTGSGPAIEILNGGFLYARDINISGYSNIITTDTTARFVGRSSLKEWSNRDYFVGETKTAFTENPTNYVSLNLSIEKTPEYFDNDFSKWANVESFGATSENDADDDGIAFQSAIDSGAEVIYFPYGKYTIKSPVIVRGNVKKIDFFFSQINETIQIGANLSVENTSSSFVVIENMDSSLPIIHNSPDSVTVRNGRVSGKDIFIDANGTGKLFLETLGPHANIRILNGSMQVWARHIDHQTAIENNGSTFWILGDNSETPFKVRPYNYPGTIITTGGGMTEVLGGALDALYTYYDSSTGAIYQSVDSQISVVSTGFVRDGGGWTTYIDDAQGTTTYLLTESEMPSVSVSATARRLIMPLYTTPRDITGPIISAIGSSVTETGATITWTTDEPSTSRVKYGLTTSYGTFTPPDLSLMTSHSMTISSLLPDTLYHYRIISKDVKVNKTTSPDNTFTTTSTPIPPPPACSDGLDNDGDGLIDYPADPGCTSTSDNDEFNEAPPPPPPPPPTPPTTNLSASPTSITEGGSSTLSWSSTYTTSCTGIGFSTGGATSGSVSVSPTITITYSVSCTGPGGSASDSATMTVSPLVYAGPFAVGDFVETTDNLNVREVPSLSSPTIGVQPTGSLGKIISGPVNADGFWWWEIDYDNTPDGWSVENWLKISINENKFYIGDTVTVTARKLHVRKAPGAKVLGFHASGNNGTVVGGPEQAKGYTWWLLDYDTAPDGWSAEDWLEKIVALQLPSHQVRAANFASTIVALKEQVAALQRNLDKLLQVE